MQKIIAQEVNSNFRGVVKRLAAAGLPDQGFTPALLIDYLNAEYKNGASIAAIIPMYSTQDKKRIITAIDNYVNDNFYNIVNSMKAAQEFIPGATPNTLSDYFFERYITGNSIYKYVPISLPSPSYQEIKSEPARAAANSFSGFKPVGKVDVFASEWNEETIRAVQDGVLILAIVILLISVIS